MRSKGLIVNDPVYACKSLKDYICVSNFSREVHFKQFEADLIAARKGNKNEAFVKHHNSKYSGVLPVWAMVETLSFGAVSRLFSSLNISLQKQICEEYYNGLRHSTIAN